MRSSTLIALTIDFVHLDVLTEDGVFWVTRGKESLCFRVVKRLPKRTHKRILSDELVVLRNKKVRGPIILTEQHRDQTEKIFLLEPIDS